MENEARRKAAAFGSTPLVVAVLPPSANLELIARLVAAGEDVNCGRNSDGATPLCLAALAGKNAAIDRLIEAGADVCQSRDDGKSPLHVAAQAGRTGAITRLLSAGADVNQRDRSGETVLHCAAREDREVLIGLLIEAGAEVDATSKSEATALRVAASFGCVGAVRRLLLARADVSKTNRAKESPLHIAARKGHAALAVELISAGADVDQDDKNRATPLFVSAQEGQEKLIEQLLEAGADVDKADRWGCTPLHAAAERGHGGVIDKLIAAGAQTTLRTTSGMAKTSGAKRGARPLPAVASEVSTNECPAVGKRTGLRVDSSSSSGSLTWTKSTRATRVTMFCSTVTRGKIIEGHHDATGGLLAWEVAEQAGHMELLDRLRNRQVLAEEERVADASGAAGVQRLRRTRAKRLKAEAKKRHAIEVEERRQERDTLPIAIKETTPA